MANQCGAPHCKIVFAEECNGSEDDPEDVMNDDGEIINDAEKATEMDGWQKYLEMVNGGPLKADVKEQTINET